MSATTVPPRAARALAGPDLVAVALRLAGVDREHVPVERAPPGERHLCHELDLGVGEAAQAPVGDVLELVPSCSLTARHSASTSSLEAHRERDRLAVAVGVRERQGGREAEAAGRERVVQQRGDRVELVGRRRVADAVGPHHVAAQRAVADHEADVERDVPVERAEIVGERPPAPRHAGLERGQRHALDLRHHAAQVVGVRGGERREREAAVAGDHARDAVQVRGARRRVPEQLRVVVGVRVDDAGRDDEPAGVDRLGGLLGHVAERDDPAVTDADVGAPAGRARPVDDGAAPDHAVEHGPTSGSPRRNRTCSILPPSSNRRG